MTDREKLLLLLSQFNLQPEVDGLSVSLVAKRGGVMGHNGFECTFQFSNQGSFEGVWVWE
jgi:hypothetical protein